MPNVIENSDDKALIDASDVELVDKASKHGGQCQVCGSSEWYVIQNPHMKTVAMIPMGSEDGEALFAGGVPAVTLTCQRCGFVRQHVKSLFDGYVKGLKDGSHE